MPGNMLPNFQPSRFRPLSALGDAVAAIPASALAAYGGLSDAANYTLDGSSKVSQWNDLSGNDRHATQSDASRRPVVSNDVGGVPGLLMNGNWSTVEHMLMDDAAVLRGTPFHVGYAIRPASNQQGCLFGDISANRRPFDWWSGAGAGSAALVNATNADFGEVHVNEIMGTPYDNTATKSDIGVDVNAGDTAIVLARDVDLKAAGGDWLGLGVAATSVNSSTNAAYSLNGRIYGFVTFTDWADAADALAWLEAQLQINSAPTASSPGLGFDVGAPS